MSEDAMRGLFCIDCGSYLVTEDERDRDWCDTCWPGVLLGDDVNG